MLSWFDYQGTRIKEATSEVKEIKINLNYSEMSVALHIDYVRILFALWTWYFA